MANSSWSVDAYAQQLIEHLRRERRWLTRTSDVLSDIRGVIEHQADMDRTSGDHRHESPSDRRAVLCFGREL